MDWRRWHVGLYGMRGRGMHLVTIRGRSYRRTIGRRRVVSGMWWWRGRWCRGVVVVVIVANWRAVGRMV